MAFNTTHNKWTQRKMVLSHGSVRVQTLLQMHDAQRRRQSMEELIISLTIKKNLLGFCAGLWPPPEQKNMEFSHLFVSTCSRHFHLIFSFNLDTVIHDRAIRFIVCCHSIRSMANLVLNFMRMLLDIELCDVDEKMKLSYIDSERNKKKMSTGPTKC